MEISVIISNYNTEKYLSRCIRSILNQSFNPNEYEVIVIDDHSTDKSTEIIAQFPNLITLYNQTNLGLSASSNIAVKKARGKYCVFVDSDDFINKNLLLVEHDFLTHNKGSIDAVSCDYYEVSEKEEIIRRRDGMAYPIRCGIMYCLDHLLELGPYDLKEPREDIDFRRRFLQAGHYIYNIPLPYYRYTQHVKSLTKNP